MQLQHGVRLKIFEFGFVKSVSTIQKVISNICVFLCNVKSKILIVKVLTINVLHD